jgi:16S rRNA processing protein RimM
VAADESATRAPEHLIVGHVTKPHGTKGELFVWPLTDRPDEIFGDGESVLVGDAGGELRAAPLTLEVEHARPFKRGLLVKFAGHDDRNAVEELTGHYLFVPAGRVAALAEGEVFFHQLIGLAVVTAADEPVGKVQEVYEAAPAHLLEIRTPDGKLKLIPFAERIVRKVDVAAGRIVIAPPAGLLDV